MTGSTVGSAVAVPFDGNRAGLSPAAPSPAPSRFAPATSPPAPDRTCVVVTYNSAATIEDCLRALAGEKVIVIDNASQDDTARRVQAAGGGVRLVRLYRNHGFACAANIGFELAEPGDAVLVNPDAVVSPATIDRLAQAARARGAGLVAPRLLYPDGRVQESARTFPCLARLLARRTRLRHTKVGGRLLADHLAPAAGSGVTTVDWVTGAVMYLPRQSLDTVGGFDERFFVYGEDVDICARLWRAGLPVVIDRDATATHVYARASQHTLDFRRRATRLHWAGILKLARKYPSAFWLGLKARPAALGARRRPQAGGPLVPVEQRWAPGRPHVRGEIPLPLLAVERAWQMVRLYENWPLAVADRLGLLRGGQVVYSVRSRYGRARLLARANGCDVRTITEVWVGELYAPDVSRPSTVPTVVDVGANCGYFAVYAGLRIPGARIVCFEPEEGNRRLAMANLALNGIAAEVRPHAVVTNGQATVELNLSADPRLHTTVESADAGRHGIGTDRYSGVKVTVPAVNINSALRPLVAGREEGRISLLKIDVEGIDLDLVAALDDDVLARTDYLVAETEDRDTSLVSARLARAGFAVHEDVNLLHGTRLGGTRA